jgi:superfamily II DNA or RNA helicase
MSEITDHHAKVFAHELLARRPSDDVGKLDAVLADAQVDLNPHQIEAALFAFRNPFSKGAILADEVGLGKTIEAGLLLSQKWAERKRHLLVIVPANLRKQWAQELSDKFFMPSIILEAKSFNDVIKTGNLNPFDQQQVVICSYHFIRSKEPYVVQTPWDLVVIDEAHRLRNVYKGTSKIATAVKTAVVDRPKVLLTATPLQNSLMELYGLVSVIDDYAFGDRESFRAQYTRGSAATDFRELKERLRPICKRTLRRQVLEFISYTDRHALVQEFYPTDEEQRLYDLVSDYLQRPSLYALPARQRHLMTLILRKLLASSSRAIAGTLQGLVDRLSEATVEQMEVDAPPDQLPEDWEDYDELADEMDEDMGTEPPPTPGLTPTQLDEARAELDDLKEFLELARSIDKNSKGEVLLSALRRGFKAAVDAQERQGAATLQQKAVIFTESRRTQDYLYELLNDTEFAGKVMLFNGTNGHPDSRAIYQGWLEKHAGTDRISESTSANMRAALVEHFRDEADILIATEAAAEGINLQFCNLVVNYDLPWNPQRVEQRIGRCHRYGQKFDVVVVNFLNKNNAADQRVYALLGEKFRLFDGVFGASDEILGAIGSGMDFERRIADIYQRCRTPQQIQFEFDALQSQLDEEITAGQREARDNLLDNFDQEVVEKVRVQSVDSLDRFNAKLWSVTKHVLRSHADFADAEKSFTLRTNPVPHEEIHRGPYRLGRAVEDANTYRVGHALAQHVLREAAATTTDPAIITFDLTGSGRNISILEPFKGTAGWLSCSRLTLDSLEIQDRLVFAGVTDAQEPFDAERCRRLFDLPGEVMGSAEGAPSELLQRELDRLTADLLDEFGTRDGAWFDGEMDKLDRWAEDRRTALRVELEQLDAALKEARRESRTAPTLPEKLECQRKVRNLETKREDAWRSYDAASREVDQQKDLLLDDLGRRLRQEVATERLFEIRWELV